MSNIPPWTWTRRVRLGFIVILVGCDPTADVVDLGGEPTAVSEQDVVGGRRETRYPAAGYLMVGSPLEGLEGPHCGATVVHRRAAVTAAHCLRNKTAAGMGFGAAGSWNEHVGTSFFIHPKYATDYDWYDLAVVLFDHDLPAAPISIAEPAGHEIARAVGYGRVTVGDRSVGGGYTNERKSTLAEIVSKVGPNLFTVMQGGGLCFGDSGGPLLSKTGSRIYGVQSRFSQGATCAVGDRMIFTSLASEMGFINNALSCLSAPTGAACQAAGAKRGVGARCVYPCARYGWPEGECKDGWKCTDGCVTEGC